MSQKLFTGTGYLTKLMVRQNRLKLLLWLVGLIAVTLATAVAYPDIYPDEQSRAAFVLTMENPAMIAMLGVGYEDYATIGSLFAHEMLLFTTIAVAIMNILLVGRSTRADEEDGRDGQDDARSRGALDVVGQVEANDAADDAKDDRQQDRADGDLGPKLHRRTAT